MDAIIVKKEQYEKVTKMIKERGFDSKTKEVKTVEFKNGSIIVSDPKGVERIFKI